MTTENFHTLTVETVSAGVWLVRLNRPQALNALNTELLGELSAVLDHAEMTEDVRALVLTGSTRAFAAGADINEMAALDMVGILNDPRQQHWQRCRAGFI